MSEHTTEGYAVTFNSQTIGGLQGVPWPANERGELETTDLASTGVETLPDLPDAGTVGFVCNFDPDDAGQQELIDNHALGDGTTQEVVITAPATSTTLATPSTLTFQAYVQAWQVNAEVRSVSRVTYTLRVQGDPVYTDPTS